MHYQRAYVDREATDAGGPIRFVAATEGVKGDDIDLRMRGARLDRFRANPVFGYGHRYWTREDLPIGMATRTVVEGDRLLIDVKFDQEDEFAQKIERKYRGGFMNAVSIGFDVTQWEGDGSWWRGGVAAEWELFELSAVPVPMDGAAVVESGRARGLDLREVLAGFPPVDPNVVVERDEDGLTRSVRVSEELIRQADPLLLAAHIARSLATGPVKEPAPVPTPEPPAPDGGVAEETRAQLLAAFEI